MSDYAESVERHARVIVLRLLADQPQYALNESLLRENTARLGVSYSRDRVRDTLAWLAKQGFITVENVGELQVATITARGADIASGVARHPGVKRPGPR
jgi:Fe2+ or Zn2+ uptake regulation protein